MTTLVGPVFGAGSVFVVAVVENLYKFIDRLQESFKRLHDVPIK